MTLFPSVLKIFQTTRFKGSGLHIKKLGINFSLQSRTIGDGVLEEEE